VPFVRPAVRRVDATREVSLTVSAGAYGKMAARSERSWILIVELSSPGKMFAAAGCRSVVWRVSTSSGALVVLLSAQGTAERMRDCCMVLTKSMSSGVSLSKSMRTPTTNELRPNVHAMSEN